MSTGAVKNSTNFAFFVGATKVMGQTGASMSIQINERDITTKDSEGWGEYIPGLASSQFTVSGIWVDSGYSVNDMRDLAVNKTLGTCKFGDGTDDYSVDSFITSFDVDSPGAEENVTFTATFRGCGVPN